MATSADPWESVQRRAAALDYHLTAAQAQALVQQAQAVARAMCGITAHEYLDAVFSILALPVSAGVKQRVIGGYHA